MTDRIEIVVKCEGVKGDPHTPIRVANMWMQIEAPHTFEVRSAFGSNETGFHPSWMGQWNKSENRMRIPCPDCSRSVIARHSRLHNLTESYRAKYVADPQTTDRRLVIDMPTLLRLLEVTPKV